MPDKTSLSLRLKTLQRSGWMHVSWHPVAGRIHASDREPARGASSEAFAFGGQMRDELAGLVLQVGGLHSP